MVKLQSFELSVTQELLDRVAAIAKSKDLSADAIWTEAMEAYLNVEEDRAWKECFEAAAADPDSTNVEYAAYAQAEVMLATPS